MARSRFLLTSTIVVAFAGVGAWYELERAEPVVKTTASPVPVTMAIASRGDLPIHLTVLGERSRSISIAVPFSRMPASSRRGVREQERSC